MVQPSIRVLNRFGALGPADPIQLYDRGHSYHRAARDVTRRSSQGDKRSPVVTHSCNLASIS